MEATSTEAISYQIPFSDGYVLDDPSQRLIIAVLVCVVSLVGIPGNGLVVLAVLLSKKLQTRTNIFVVNLAVADFLTCLVLPFQAIALLHKCWPFPDYLCTGVAMVTSECMGSSVINLAVIAFMRYFIITKPRQICDRLFSKLNMTVFVIGTWLVPFLLIFFPHLYGLGRLGYSPRYRVCSADSSHPSSDYLAILGGVIIDCPAFLVIIVFYVKIYLFVRASTQKVIRLARTETMQTSGRSKLPKTLMEAAVFRRHVKVTKNLFLVVCLFFICIIPYALCTIIPAPTYPVVPWTSAVLLFNSCVNPFIYALKHPQFKEVLRTILTCF